MKLQVLSIVEKFPDATTNYNKLLHYYWAIYDDATSIADIHNATPAESITRAFRQLVGSGAISVPIQTRRVREKKEREFADEFGHMR